jgi:hypothetical protein
MERCHVGVVLKMEKYVPEKNTGKLEEEVDMRELFKKMRSSYLRTIAGERLTGEENLVNISRIAKRSMQENMHKYLILVLAHLKGNSCVPESIKVYEIGQFFSVAENFFIGSSPQDKKDFEFVYKIKDEYLEEYMFR